MSERMTDERWNHLNASETVWTKREQAEVAGEVNALQVDVMEKDAIIKALADALWGDGHVGESGRFHVGTCRTFGHSEECDKADAALRLAGRLP